MTKNGLTVTGNQALRCAVCKKQVSGKKVEDLLTQQRGTPWKVEAVQRMQKVTPDSARSGDQTVVKKVTTKRNKWKSMKRAR